MHLLQPPIYCIVHAHTMVACKPVATGCRAPTTDSEQTLTGTLGPPFPSSPVVPLPSDLSIPGGRLFTHHFNPTSYCDIGGMRLPPHHVRVHALIKELQEVYNKKLDLVPYVLSNPNARCVSAQKVGKASVLPRRSCGMHMPPNQQ